MKNWLKNEAVTMAVFASQMEETTVEGSGIDEEETLEEPEVIIIDA